MPSSAPVAAFGLAPCVSPHRSIIPSAPSTSTAPPAPPASSPRPARRRARARAPAPDPHAAPRPAHADAATSKLSAPLKRPSCSTAPGAAAETEAAAAVAATEAAAAAAAAAATAAATVATTKEAADKAPATALHGSLLSSPPNARDERAAVHARNELTVKSLWLVAAVARKAHHTYVRAFPEMSAALSLADITQEGVVGLMAAVERWDPHRGYAFDSYAFYTIKHAIMRAIENQSRPIRLPVHVLNKLSKMRKVRQHLDAAALQTGAPPPSMEEVARAAGVSPHQAELYHDRSRIMCSIDAPLSRSADSAFTLREFLVDHSVDVARQVERECTREAVAELVQSSGLEDLERSVLLLKYGLNDGVTRVRTEVSRLLDVRVAKVRRAELSALKKLRGNVSNDMAAWSELLS